MSKVKHTPGPWTITGDGETASFIVSGNKREIANLSADYDETSPWSLEQEANALLIAAAPDLLEQAKLLEKVLVYEIRKDELKGDDEGANLKSFTLHQCRAAIAKAEGITHPANPLLSNIAKALP